MEMMDISLSKIVDINSKRRRKDISRLCISIKHRGLLQPLVVRKHKHGRWAIDSGGQRLAALKHLKRQGAVVPGIDDWKIPCIISDGCPEEHDITRLVHNVHATYLPSEWGSAYLEILKTSSSSVGFLAQATGKTVHQVELLMEVALAPDKLRKKVDSGELSLTAFDKIKKQSPKVKSAVADVEGKVTVKKALQIAKEKTETGTVIPGIEADAPTLVQQLSLAYDAIHEVVNAPVVGPREQYWLSEIKQLVSS